MPAVSSVEVVEVSWRETVSRARTKDMTRRLRAVPDSPAAVAPLLKWAGGKRWFVKEFGDDMFDLVARRGGRYIEPFLGGGAMALHLGIQGMVLGDLEPDLMLMYSQVRDAPEELITLLSLLQEMGTDLDTYYDVRELDGQTTVEKAAKLIYLNRLCFNGLYRKNKKGEFNVPYCGEERDLPDGDRIMEVSRALQGAELHIGDANKLIESAGRGDVIYADPPYHGTFSDYTARGFEEDDQELLVEALYDARQRGAEFFCHNADTEKVRYWFEEWAEIIPMDEKRNINAKGDERGAVGCVLIVGADDE